MNQFYRSASDVLSSNNKYSYEDINGADSEDDLNEDEVSSKESSNNEARNVSPTLLLGPSGGLLFRATLPANAHILSDQATTMTSLRQQIAITMWAAPH